MGELHLDIIVDRLRREFKVEANVAEPQVSYRETITVPATIEGKLYANQVDVDNMDMLLSNLNQTQVKDLNSLIKLLVESCQEKIFQQFKKV